MYIQANVNCECGCIFEVEFQGSSYSQSPVCPRCKNKMDSTSWKELRNTMGCLNDFNEHIIKWNSEHNEPRMMVPVLTVKTVKPEGSSDVVIPE